MATTAALPSRGRRLVARARQSTLGPAGLVIVLTFVAAALLAPWLAPYDPTQPDLLNRLAPPAWTAEGNAVHLLGTDQLGRDVLSRLIYGTRTPIMQDSVRRQPRAGRWVIDLAIPPGCWYGRRVGLPAHVYLTRWHEIHGGSDE